MGRSQAQVRATPSAHGSTPTPGRAGSRRFRFLLVFSLGGAALGTLACTGPSAFEELPSALDGAMPTMDALGDHVLGSLTRQDTAALNQVRLTEHEHNGVVWPELPASEPEVNFPVDYAWSNIQNRNRRGLSRLLPLFADRSAGYQRVECRGDVEEFDTFVVHTDCWVVFTVDGSPRLWEAQLFKDVLVRGGGHKVFRFYDEEPRPYGGPAATTP